jgi:hypothetical protein
VGELYSLSYTKPGGQKPRAIIPARVNLISELEPVIGRGFWTAVGWLLAKATPKCIEMYKRRRIYPKVAHQKVLNEQAQWYSERANKLVVAECPIWGKFNFGG